MEFPNIFGYGVDIINQAVPNYCTEVDNANCDFFNMRAQDISDMWHERFDIVTVFDVLEHVLNYEETMQAIEDVTKNGGAIIINLPKIIKEKRHGDYLKLMLERKPEHLRKFTLKYIIKTFGSRNNFQMYSCKDERNDDSYFFKYTK